MDAQTKMIETTGYTPTKRSTDVSQIVKQATAILRRRWLMVATIIIVIFGATLAAVMTMTPKYEAVAFIKIDPSPGAAIGQMTERTGMPDQALVETEVSVMRSLENARAVVERLKLDQDAEFAQKLPPLAPGAPKAQVERRLDTVASAVLGGLTAERDKATYIVQLGYLSRDPVKAARIANAFAAEYMDANLGRRTGTAEREARFLDQRLSQLNAQAGAATQQMAEYKARAGVIGTAGGGVSTSIDQQIVPLAGQFATAQSEAAATDAKVRSAEQQIRAGNLDSIPGVLTSDVVRNLRAQRASVLDAKSEVMARYGPKHPETLRVTGQLEAIDEQIKDEANRIVAGLRADAISSRARAQSLAGELGNLRAQQATTTRSSAIADTYQRQADSAQSAYDRLAEKAQTSAQAAGSSISQAQVIEQATPPLTPSKPNKRALLAMGLLASLAVAVSAVAVLEIFNTGIMSVAEIESLGAPVLGTIPRLAASEWKKADDDIRSPADHLLARPVSFYAEAYRAIRTSFILGHVNGAQVISIVSTLPDEGKTNSALSLARVMAMAGETTIVIDCDLRRAGLTKLAGLSVDAGLVEVIKGEIPLEEAICKDKAAGLDILPLSRSLFSPEDMFSGEAMLSVLATLRKRYRHIVIDTPPLLGLIDARTLAALSDAVAMVVKWNATPRQAVASALDLLQSDHTPISGVILTMVDSSVEAYGAMYYSKKYSSYYSEGKADTPPTS